MSELKFKTIEKDDYTIVHFDLERPIVPEILRDVISPKVDSTKGVVLSGRGPIWLYCYLAHCYHYTKFIATFDPRIGGAVVVESHEQNREPGDILEVDEDGL